VVGALVGGEGVFGEVPMEELAELVRGATHDLLDSGAPVARARGRTQP
jgi:hypothetical protein